MKRNQITILLCLLAVILYPIVVKDLYFMHMAILIGIYAMSAISVNLILGYAGQLSLGHTAFFGVGSYLSALAFLNLGIPLWGGMVFALVGSGILGYIVAKLALKLRGAYFVIMTIGVAEVLKLVALNWVGVTKGPMGLTDIAAPTLSLGQMGTLNFSGKVPYYYLVLLFLVLSAALQYRLIRSPFGRAFISIRENEDLARSVGINSYKYLVIVVVISASIAGVSGALYAHYVSFIDPGVFAFFFSVNLVMMVIGGGQGTFIGPILGAILFTAIPELLRVFGDTRIAIYALLVIFFVIFMPKGVLFYLSKLFKGSRDEAVESLRAEAGKGEGSVL
jgi:branched-chain amino acid transport system permease protein